MFTGIGLNINAHHWVAVVIACIAAAGTAYWAYRRTNPPLPGKLAVLLFIIRTMAIALLVLVLLEPILNLMWRRTERPVIAVLVDASASMSITEDGVDRLSLARAFLAGDAMDRIGSRGDALYYRFAEQARPWTGDSLTADGLATDIAGALETVKKESGEANLQAVILLTDGANNLGRNPANLARSYGRPIYPIGIGSAQPHRDIGVTDVLTAEAVYKDSRVPVEVKVRSRGLEGLQIPVILSAGDEVLARQPVTLGGDGREQSLTLEYTPREEGLLRLRVSIPLQDGELVAGNNRRDLSVNVLKSKLKALLVWGRPTWDFSFLRRSLEEDPNVDLTPLVCRGTGSFFLGDFPQNEQQLRVFDVVILGDSAPLKLAAERQQWIARLVTEQGKGLLLVGGPGFGLQARTPLADLSPLAPPTGRSGPAQERFWVELTSAGRVHPVMLLEDEILDPQQVWDDIPPFSGFISMGPPKAGASVLAQHREHQTGTGPLPLIAVQTAGTGRSMIAAVYPLWRWSFMMAGLDRTELTYDRFWSNAIRWLTTREEGRTIRVRPVQNVFRSGQRIAFQGRIFDESYRPMDRARVKVLALRKGAEDSDGIEGDLFDSGRRDGVYRGELPVLPPGEYVYRAEVSLGGQRVGQDEGEFFVEEYSLEFERVELNEELLRTIARDSGGQYFPVAQAAGVSAAVPMNSREVSGQRELELWNHPAVLVTLILLLAVEWTIRKKNRLL